MAFERARAVCGLAARGEVLVSRTVTDLVAGSGVTFVDRGAHPLVRGGDAWRLFAVAEVVMTRPAEPRAGRAAIVAARGSSRRPGAARVAVLT